MKYGWIPDRPDHRDVKFVPRLRNRKGLPDAVDWSPALPACYDQGELGSCTANALAGAVQFLQRVKVMPSRLFIYFNERELEDSIPMDAGAMIRDGLKSLISDGVCPESDWPYQVERFADRPPNGCYDQAQGLEVLSYLRVDNTSLEDLLEALTAGPVVGGFSVYESFESDVVARTGQAPLPGKNERCVGGHAILVCGYIQAVRSFLVRNSWGTSWGLRGYFWIPFDYFTNGDLADDFWLLRALT